MLCLLRCCVSWFLAGGILSGILASASLGAEPELIDVFTAGQEGYHTFRIPAIITAPGGDLLAFCEGRKTGRGDHGDLDLVLKRSSDGGRTWGPLQLVYEEGGDKKVTIGNPCPVVDQSTGVIWLPFNRDNREVLVTSSSDQGKTWSKPRDITADVKASDWDWYACGPGNAIQLTVGKHAGRLVIPCDHRVRGQGSWDAAGRSHVFYSDDHGKTWQRGGATDFAMNECAVVQRSDGQLLLNMRSYRGKNCRAVALSSDGGDTWGPATDDASLPEPVCQGSLVRYSGADDPRGSILLFSNPASKGRDHLTVRMSTDEGKTWDHSRLLYAGSSAYSCIVPLPEGAFGVLLERDNYQKITFARCTLDWLEQ
ncbi:sialidase family protein [Lignipirellula cremea]|uniref:exo-alpha-sialidase n=1 Tax=Lignipirellula cremea TaxID=2528010 RepID=A0A518DTH8_9BACT|nr:sialidase family protein [Lignipirellula cremea]QDU95146.1 Sialidase precursor [Lignipirellula cremea]